MEAALEFVNGARPAFNFLAQLDRARIWAAAGNHEEALASLPAARSALKSHQSVLLAEADELEARLRLSLGDTRGAHSTAGQLPPPRRAVVEAIIALAGGDHVAAARALESAPAVGSTLRSDIELQLLRANVKLVSSPRDAPQIVRGALDAAQRHGFVQTVLDTAPQLLDHVVSHPDLYPAAWDLRALFAANVDAKALTASRPHGGVAAPLTDAELRVLSKLADHYTFGEIARELCVSINTVKTHAHHAYRKLEVNRRSDAISRATVLGILR